MTPGKTFWIIASEDLAGIDVHYAGAHKGWLPRWAGTRAKRFKSKTEVDRLLIGMRLSDDSLEWQNAQIVAMAELDEEVW